MVNELVQKCHCVLSVGGLSHSASSPYHLTTHLLGDVNTAVLVILY